MIISNLNYLNNTKNKLRYLKEFKQILDLIALGEGLNYNFTIDLTLIEAEEMRTNCLEFKNKDYIADVLSFPSKIQLFDYEEKTFFIGEILMCPSQIYEQAKNFGHTNKREFCYMFAHSVFHLLGYDHIKPNEEIRMHNKIEEIMQKLQISR